MSLAADPDRDFVYLINTGNYVYTLPLEPNDEPGRVAVGPPNRAFVALRGASAVVEIDLTTHAIVARHKVCPAPRGLAWSAAKNELYVACATGELTQLWFTSEGTRLTLQLASQSHPADDLRDVIVVPDGVLISTFRNARVRKVTDDGAVSFQPAPADSDGLDESRPAKRFVPHVAWRMIAARVA